MHKAEQMAKRTLQGTQPHTDHIRRLIHYLLPPSGGVWKCSSCLSAAERRRKTCWRHSHWLKNTDGPDVKKQVVWFQANAWTTLAAVPSRAPPAPPPLRFFSLCRLCKWRCCQCFFAMGASISTADLIVWSWIENPRRELNESQLKPYHFNQNAFLMAWI